MLTQDTNFEQLPWLIKHYNERKQQNITKRYKSIISTPTSNEDPIKTDLVDVVTAGDAVASVAAGAVAADSTAVRVCALGQQVATAIVA